MTIGIEHFEGLSWAERTAVIQRMATEGFGDYGIAQATALSVEQVRAALAENGARLEGEPRSLA